MIGFLHREDVVMKGEDRFLCEPAQVRLLLFF